VKEELGNSSEEKESKGFRNSKPVGKWISVIYRKFQMGINKELKKYNISSSQYIFLVQLYQEDGVSQESLSKSLHIDKSATARAIKQLEESGFITRDVNPNDKRGYLVSLTKKALDIETELFDILKDWNRKLTQNLSDEEYEIAYKLIYQMSLDALK